MADAFIGEIRMLPYTFAPVGWLACDGQQYNIQQFTPLYAVIGTIYGGDGSRYFQVPNLSGRFSIGMGQGPGLTNRTLASTVGESTITLNQTTIPSHNHTIVTDGILGKTPNPAGQYTARDASNKKFLNNPDTSTLKAMAAQALNYAGTSPATPHENMQPYLALNFFINYDGEFPPRPS